MLIYAGSVGVPVLEAVNSQADNLPAQRRLTLIVPCFNEGAGISEFFERVEKVLARLPAYQHEIICIDDGSQDDTLERLRAHALRNPSIMVLELSRNFGKEAALTARLDMATGDAAIPIDADLQHPPELIEQMVAQWEADSDVVLARRMSRNTSSLSRRLAANCFYALQNRLSDNKIPRDVGDFRLMDRSVIDAVKSLPQRGRFMKGLFAWVGFRQTTLEFTVGARLAGVSAYNWRKSIALATHGMFSFSTVPLIAWTFIGFGVAVTALFGGFWIVLKPLLFGIDVPGFASLLTAVLFMGGVQLMSIGILGQYLGRVYNETKARPVYIVRKRYGVAAPDYAA